MSTVFNRVRMASGWVLAAGALLAASPMAQAACLNQDGRKACVTLSAQPEDVVQASRLDGVHDTFVRYTATLTNVSLPTSSRNLELTLSLSPAVEIVEFDGTSHGVCSVSGATATCTYDKLDSASPLHVTMTAKAPAYAGAATPATLVNTATIGWNGRGTSTSDTVAVSTAGGYTWVPANTAVVLTTHPRAADPSQQTTPEDPVYAEMAIPARSVGFLAYFALTGNADEDFSASCTAGVFISGNSDGGPYACRDLGAPVDPGNPRRWVEAYIDESVDGSFTDSPVKVTLIWDDSVVPPTQVAPTALAPNGTPPVAIFYRAPQIGAEDHPIRAYARPCAANPLPCTSGVQNFATGDWSATLETSIIDNGGEAADPLLPGGLLSGLGSVLDFLVAVAHGQVLKPPSIMR
jgi:hypothetical protein